MSFHETHTKSMLWHSGKSLLCIAQLLLLHRVADMGINALLFELTEVKSLKFALLHLCADLAVFIALWWYYDRIDDYSFNRFCEAPITPNLLRDPGFITGHVLTTIGATLILTQPVAAVLRFTALRSTEIIAATLSSTAVFVTAASLIRIHRLSDIWAIQKDLREPIKEKKPSLITYWVCHILYAAIYLGSLAALVYCGISVFLPILWPLVWALTHLLWIPFLVFLGLLVVLDMIRYVRHVLDRRKFLHRLEALRDKGELSFEIHGSPYRSLFGYSKDFGLTIIDRPHPDGKKKTETTYRVAFANCHRRRLTVILCDHQIYQFMYSVNIRFMRTMRGGLGMMGMAGVHGIRTFTLPTASWFVSHSFTFPEGEGERILLVDPTPHVLCLRENGKEKLSPLDNNSKIFGYTVYGKNSFVNMLERT